MKLSELNERIAKFQGECNCISLIDPDSEGEFSWKGCDICSPYIGNNVFQVNGYNPKTREIEELGQICSKCLCYIYNGDIPENVEIDE